MKKIIYLLGTDGAGKTTLANNLLEHYKKSNIPFNYFYARHFPVLLKILKVIGRRTVLKTTDEFLNYNEYKSRKNNFFNKHKVIARVYASIWVVDYLLITFIRFLPIRISNKNILIDRFYIDAAINITESTCLTISEFNTVLNFFELFFPVPQKCFFIDVNPEIAFKRKNDIQSIQYLEEKRAAYIKLSKRYNFIMINGENNIDDVFIAVKNFVDRFILEK
jgi:thymidylate kinase